MRKRILVVDDDPQITKIIKLILSATDAYEVETCNDPLEAYARAVGQPYDLLILDMQMPLRGDEISNFLLDYKNEGFVRPPMLFISGEMSCEELVQKRQAEEAETFLTKPFHPGTLLRIVSTIVQNRANNAIGVGSLSC